MQNKKSLLQRLLFIYITFFIVLIASIAHSLVPNFSKGYVAGSEMGNEIAKNWLSGTPRMIYMLGNIPVLEQQEVIAANEGALAASVKASVSRINLVVEQDAPGASVLSLAFRSLGGQIWIYALMMLGTLAYIAIIVLMFLIIHSLRRSIREECPLARRNIWLLRTIGLLTIFTELSHALIGWSMNSKAAELLAGSGYTVDTSFPLSYSTIILGILILFAAEVFAIGQNLSEEQKLTI